MNRCEPAVEPNKGTALFLVVSILALSLFLQAEISSRQALLFLVAVGLGISLMHAMFGFTGGWSRFIRSRHSAGIRGQLLLFALAATLFFPVLAGVFPALHASPALAPVGTSVAVGAFLFGIGMLLGGGCASGTLFTVGQGQTDMIITLIFFILGSFIGSIHLPWWLELPSAGRISLIRELGWPSALALELALLAAIYLLVTRVERRRNGAVVSLFEVPGDQHKPFLDRLIFGPWPLAWGALGLALFAFLTLLLAGHPWSITFAFGLWGAKLYQAFGGDPTHFSYWSSGYPLRALNHSVLAEVTSVMNFGIMFGAGLAAALAGKFAPAQYIPAKRVVAAVLGGLLMGYGARLAFGCNIGALLGGISSGSLHGWLWAVTGFLGAMAGVRARIWLRLDPPLGRH